MLSYVLIITAVVLVIGGIVYLIKGGRDETPSLLSRPGEAAGVSGAPVTAKPLELSGVLAPEPLQTRVTDLEQELHALQERAAAKAVADQQTITGLTQENDKFKKQLEQKESESSRLATEIEATRLSYERLKAEEDARIQDFRQDVARMEAERTKLLSDKQTAEELKMRTQALERLEEEKAARIDQLAKELGEVRDGALSQQTHWQAERERLAAEHADLLAQAGGYRQEIERLKKDLELMQKINNQKLNEANDMVRLLEAQKSESDRIQEEVLGKQLAQAMGKVGELNQERDHLMQVRVALEENLGKTRDFNAYLLEKEKVLHYELTKQRAQALGFEKICEDFKIQIDDLTKAAVAN